jgi:alpha-tubulin suppressor-like RCC1 family protein
MNPGVATMVDGGGQHSCALRADGSIACWAKLDFDKYVDTSVAPAGTFTKVTSGSGHTCALRSDGTVACWGDNQARQCVPAVPGTP